MTSEAKKALQTVKEDLAEMFALAHRSTDEKAVFFLLRDVSAESVSAEVQQIVNGAAQPWSFFSRKLQSAQPK